MFLKKCVEKLVVLGFERPFAVAGRNLPLYRFSVLFFFSGNSTNRMNGRIQKRVIDFQNDLKLNKMLV